MHKNGSIVTKIEDIISEQTVPQCCISFVICMQTSDNVVLRAYPKLKDTHRIKSALKSFCIVIKRVHSVEIASLYL